MFAESLTMIETARIAAFSDPHRRMAGWSGEPERTSVRPAPGSVKLRGLSKAFGDVAVLDGVDLTIPAGQFVAIVGKSGCGKSTLLRLVMGLETPSGGTIEGVGRREGVEGSAARFMFQEPRLLPWTTVAENVAVGIPRGVPKTEKRRRSIEALEEVGLADRADAWPTILSGGQRQRVALARALVGHPHLLAFDEPLGALDALTRMSMQRLVERVWLSQGFTAILVTHDVGEAIALADRILLIDAGSIALDIAVDLPRPRRRGTSGFAALEKTVLDALFAGAGDAA